METCDIDFWMDMLVIFAAPSGFFAALCLIEPWLMRTLDVVGKIGRGMATRRTEGNLGK